MISIVIITRNEAGNIGRLLTQLLRLSAPNLVEILVVDGASTDQTRNIVRDFAMRYVMVRLVCLPSYGFALQRNIGALEARGEHILYLSADVVPTPNLLLKYSAAITRGYEIVQGSAVDICQDPGTISQLLCCFRSFAYRSNAPAIPAHASTVNLLIRRSLVIEDPFDEGLIACEDKELVLRIHHNVPCTRLATAAVYHLFRASPTQFWRKAFREALCIGQMAARRPLLRAFREVNFFNWITLTAAYWVITPLTVLLAIASLRGRPVVSATLAVLTFWVGISLWWLRGFLMALLARQPRTALHYPWMALGHTTAVIGGITAGYVTQLIARPKTLA